MVSSRQAGGTGPHARRLRFEAMEERALLSIGATPYLPPQHSLQNLEGYLTGPSSGSPREIAFDYLRANAAGLGLTAEDFSHAIVTDQYRDADTGVTHIYLRQEYQGLEVMDAELVINIDTLGCVMNVGGGFVPGLNSGSGEITAAVGGTACSAVAALQSLGSALGIGGVVGPFAEAAVVDDGSGASGVDAHTTLLDPRLSLDPIPTKLHYVPTESGVVLAWDYILRTPDGEHWYDASADATTGAVAAVSDWVDNASYDVFARPVESPIDGTRSIVTDPQDAAASPYGWHDTNGVAGAEYTDTRGNNVSAQDDTDANNTGGFRPDGTASLTFDYPLDLTQAPSGYQSAAITNLFYWNNVCHDLHYKYGFNEVAGDFQVKNYTGQGLGNDAVQADAQDGSGTNNANFATPPDGSSPRMQMFVFTSTSPRRDGDLQSEVIVHEYGHGVSNRLVGGPSNVNALNAVQSGGMGEGWSDWWGLMFTQKTTDIQSAKYPVGNYVVGQSSTGGGIRRYPYSFDMSVDPLTYGNIRVSSEVHNEGEVWCSVLWDMNWLLINKYGFNPDVSVGYSAGCAGNILALKLVEDSLKLMPTNPSFLQSRDAILLADRNLTGGANQGEIWTAFARRGMGYSAYDGGSGSSTNVTEAFDAPSFRVLGQTPSGTTATVPGSIDFQFSRNILQSSFAVADDVVSFTGPGGADLRSQITGYSFPAANTLRLTFNQQAAQGVYSIVIGPNISAADGTGAMDQNANGTSAEPTADRYTGTFKYDAVTMQVASTSPANGGVLTLTSPTMPLQVTFNEAYDPASIGTSDLVLSAGTVVGARQINATTVAYDLSGISAEQTLTVTMAAGAVTDVYGNPAMAFSGSYQTDIATVAFPTPLTAKSPLGSLVYDGSVAGAISPAGDTDRFTISLDAGQTITAVVHPGTGLQPTIAMTGPGIDVGPLTASAVGKTVLIETARVATAGTYAFVVGGAAGTAGTFTLQLTLNAAQELEANDGPTNDTLATAQDLDGSFIGISGAAQRGAVAGTLPTGAGATAVCSENFDAGSPLGPQWSTYSSNAAGRIMVSNAYATAGGAYALLMDSGSSGSYNLNEAVWTVDLSAVASPTLSFYHATWADENDAFSGDFAGHYTADGMAISADGVTWHPVWNGTSQTSGAWQQVTVDLAAQAASHGITLGSSFKIKFQQYDNYMIATDGRGYDQIVITTPAPTEDWYKFTLDAGQSSTLALAASAAGAALQLYDGGGRLLSTGVTASNLSGVINNFVATTSGVYYARVAGVNADYRLAVTRNASFDVEPNSTIAAAQDITATKTALGYLESGATGNDYYRVHLDAGAGVRILTATPGDASGQFVNLLDPQIEFYNPSGALVASDDNGAADGRNAQLTYVATAGGDYVIRVLPAAGTGEYVLSVDSSLVTVTLPADAREGDGTVTGAITIPAALDSDLVVSLASSDPGRATVPASVTIPAGSTSAPLPIAIVDNTLLDGLESVLITATTAALGVSGGAITIHDDETTTLAVSLPVSAMEGVGVLTGIGTLTVVAAPTRDITVSLQSSDTSELTVPATVILRAGQTTATFDVTIVDDALIDGNQTPMATASVE
ncbi:MAG: M36 family metallopeptidase, partial [Thermoguttaceae bacterium]